MELEKLQSSKFNILTEEQLRSVKGGDRKIVTGTSGSGSSPTGRFNGTSAEYHHWDKDETGYYLDEITGERADFVSLYNEGFYYIPMA